MRDQEPSGDPLPGRPREATTPRADPRLNTELDSTPDDALDGDDDPAAFSQLP